MPELNVWTSRNLYWVSKSTKIATNASADKIIDVNQICWNFKIDCIAKWLRKLFCWTVWLFMNSRNTATLKSGNTYSPYLNCNGQLSFLNICEQSFMKINIFEQKWQSSFPLCWQSPNNFQVFFSSVQFLITLSAFCPENRKFLEILSRYRWFHFRSWNWPSKLWARASTTQDGDVDTHWHSLRMDGNSSSYTIFHSAFVLIFIPRITKCEETVHCLSKVPDAMLL